MEISRARFVRGLGVASLLLPAAAFAKPGIASSEGFTPDLSAKGAVPVSRGANQVVGQV